MLFLRAITKVKKEYVEYAMKTRKCLDVTENILFKKQSLCSKCTDSKEADTDCMGRQEGPGNQKTFCKEGKPKKSSEGWRGLLMVILQWGGK